MCQCANDRRGNRIVGTECVFSLLMALHCICKVVAREKAQQMFEMIVYTVPFDIIRKCRSEV